MNTIEIKTSQLEDDYRIFWCDRIGSGANGIVYSCVNKKTWKNYAVKVIADKPKARREVEMQIACQSSKYVVPIIDVYSNPSKESNKNYSHQLYIIMENMRGGELFNLIENYSHVLMEQHWCKIIKQIVLAIKDIHDLGIIHRDIKPENIFIRDVYEINALSPADEAVDSMEIMIGDFGFAVREETRPCDALFTPYYVAPEILANDMRYKLDKTDTTQMPYDSRCDLWSLGVVIYALLSNIPPFYPEVQAKSITKRMYNNILSGNFHFKYDIWSTISYESKVLISDLIQVNPDDRLTIQEVMEHIWFKDMGSEFEIENPIHKSIAMQDISSLQDTLIPSGIDTKEDSDSSSFRWTESSSSNESESSEGELLERRYTCTLVIKLDDAWMRRDECLIN